MNRAEYVALLDRITTRGADARVHWASGPRAGTIDPWDGTSAPPGRTVPGQGQAYRETADGSLFTEALVGEPHLIIAGAGHVGVAVARIAPTLGFRITVIDARPALLEKARLPGVDELLCGPFEETLAGLPDYANAYYVLVTPGHASDRESAVAVLLKPSVYVGMIGSRGKVATTLNNLRADGISEERIADLHAPIGLHLGGREPAEIAIAILAEIITVRAKAGAVTFNAEVAAELRRLAEAPEEPAVLVTIIGHGGSAPRGTGSRMVAGPTGLTAGTIGGGRVEAEAIVHAQELLTGGPVTDVVDYDLSNRESAVLGMICGGRVKVLFERL